MKWAHIAGRTNVADPLSRNPAFSEATALFIQRLSANDPLHMREIAPDILHGYTEDLWFDNPHNTKYLSKRADGFWVGTGKSIRAESESQIVVPNGNSLKARILFAFHDTQRSGHGGIDRTFRSVARYYWWPAMRLDVVDYAGLKGPAFQNVWTQACQEAFLGIKESLTKAPLLAHPDPAKDYRAVTDASVVGTGGVLMQDGRPIAYHSHKFSSAERNYSTGEQELLAVYLALKEWRCYLEGCTGKFELDTDHEPLVYLANQPMLSR
eukprot:gene28090-biopygen32038